MSDKDRWVLFFLVTICILWIMQWQQLGKQEEQKRESAAAESTAGGDSATTRTLGLSPSSATAATTTATLAQSPPLESAGLFEGEERLIDVATDRLRVRLTNRGGRPLSWRILLQPNGQTPGDVEIVELIPRIAGRDSDELPLEIGFRQFNTLDFHPLNRMYFETEVQTPDANTTLVRFVSPVVEEMRLIKELRFENGSYLTGLTAEVQNLSTSRVNIESEGVSLSWGPGFHDYGRKLTQAVDLMFINTYSALPDEFSYNVPSDPQGRRFRVFAGRGAVETGGVRWGGIQDKFFTAILIPARQGEAWSSRALLREKNRITNVEQAALNSPPYTYELISRPFVLQPAGDADSSRKLDYEIYTGPIETVHLVEASRHINAAIAAENAGGEPVNLNRLMFYSSWFWMRALCFALLWMLNTLYGWVGSWGLAIVLLTIIVKLLTHPLNHTALKHQAVYGEQIRKVKPELDALNEKYKGDAAKRSQEMLKLFKKHNISQFGPLKGCLPMIIQIPVLFGLYRICSQTFSLRGAEFLYIENLAQPDQLLSFAALTFGLVQEIFYFGEYFNLLPLLMGASQFVITRYASTTQPTDPNQKMILYLMPWIMTIMLYKLPSGLFVYWIIGNLWQFVHTFQAKKQVHAALLHGLEQSPGMPLAESKGK